MLRGFSRLFYHTIRIQYYSLETSYFLRLLSIYLFIYLFILMCARYWTRIIGKLVKKQDNGARAPRRVSHLLCFSPLQWLTREFKHKTFSDLNSVFEVSTREQDQRRLQTRKKWTRPDTIHINCNCIAFRKYTLFLYLIAREKEWCGYKNSLPSLRELLRISYF